MNALPIVGRILVGIPFFMMGMMHFMKSDVFEMMVPFGGIAIVYLVGAVNLMLAMAMFLGKQQRNAGLLAAFMLMAFILGVHVPGMMNAGENEMAMMMAMSGAIKDMGIMGGAILVAVTAKE